MKTVAIIGLIVLSIIGIAFAVLIQDDNKEDNIEINDKEPDNIEINDKEPDNIEINDEPKKYTVGLSESLGVTNNP
jgi:hypothetical protein